MLIIKKNKYNLALRKASIFVKNFSNFYNEKGLSFFSINVKKDLNIEDKEVVFSFNKDKFRKRLYKSFFYKKVKTKVNIKGKVIGFDKNNSEFKSKKRKNAIDKMSFFYNAVKRRRFRRLRYLFRRKHFNLKISSKRLKTFDSLNLRRFKVLRRLGRLRFKKVLNISKKYLNIRWVRNPRLTFLIRKYRKEVSFLQSQGRLRKFFRKRKTQYGLMFQEKQRLKIFYGGLKEYNLRNLLRKVFFFKKNNKNIFVGLLESRLSSIVFRSGLFSSFFLVKEVIKFGIIRVNGVKVCNPGFLVVPGSFVEVDKNYINKWKFSFYNRFKKRLSLFFYPSFFLEISFSLGIFYFYRRPFVHEVPYACNLNLNRVLTFYNSFGLR